MSEMRPACAARMASNRKVVGRVAARPSAGSAEPMTQRAVYEWLATHFARALPPSGPIPTDRKRGWTSKRVSNARLHTLDWAPRYASFRDAVVAHGTQLAGV